MQLSGGFPPSQLDASPGGSLMLRCSCARVSHSLAASPTHDTRPSPLNPQSAWHQYASQRAATLSNGRLCRIFGSDLEQPAHLTQLPSSYLRTLQRICLGESHIRKLPRFPVSPHAPFPKAINVWQAAVRSSKHSVP
ncbi:hypothetical protein C8Q80DRAFT_869980 [Daedaleopsis nitida]|nr:hypothetical protein C8Q80DRAFT_869980 [Daedaleopsis nitida]